MALSGILLNAGFGASTAMQPKRQRSTTTQPVKALSGEANFRPPQTQFADLVSLLVGNGVAQPTQFNPAVGMPQASQFNLQPPPPVDPYIMNALNRVTPEGNAQPMAQGRDALLGRARDAEVNAAKKTPKGVRGPSLKELAIPLMLLAAAGPNAGDMARGMLKGYMDADDQERQDQEAEYHREQAQAQLESQGLREQAQVVEGDRREYLNRADRITERDEADARLLRREESERLGRKEDLEGDLAKIVKAGEVQEKVQNAKNTGAKDVATIRAGATVASSRMKLHGASMTQYVKMLNEGDVTQRQVALQAIRRADPFFADMDDDTLMDAARDLNPRADQQHASAELMKGRNERESKMFDTDKKLKESSAAANNARAKVLNEEWYPKSLAEKIQATKLMAEAEGKGPGGVSATAQYNSDRIMGQDLAKTEAHLKYVKEEKRLAQLRIDAIKGGAKKVRATELEELQEIIRNDDAQLAYYSELKKQVGDLKTELKGQSRSSAGSQSTGAPAIASGQKVLGQTVRTGEEAEFAKAQEAIAKGAPEAKVKALLVERLKALRKG